MYRLNFVVDAFNLFNHTMVSGSDGVYVAAPAWHTYMEGVLTGVPDKWYSPPANVVKVPCRRLMDAQSRASSWFWSRVLSTQPAYSPSASGTRAAGIAALSPPKRAVVESRPCSRMMP